MPKVRIPAANTPEFQKTLGLVPPAPPIDLNAIGKALRLKRKAQGLTLDEAAKLLNVSKSTLIKIENGKDVYVSTLNWVLERFNIRLTLKADAILSDEEWF